VTRCGGLEDPTRRAAHEAGHAAVHLEVAVRTLDDPGAPDRGAGAERDELAGSARGRTGGWGHRRHPAAGYSRRTTTMQRSSRCDVTDRHRRRVPPRRVRRAADQREHAHGRRARRPTAQLRIASHSRLEEADEPFAGGGGVSRDREGASRMVNTTTQHRTGGRPATGFCGTSDVSQLAKAVPGFSGGVELSGGSRGAFGERAGPKRSGRGAAWRRPRPRRHEDECRHGELRTKMATGGRPYGPIGRQFRVDAIP